MYSVRKFYQFRKMYPTSKRMAAQNPIHTTSHSTNAGCVHIDAVDQSNIMGNTNHWIKTRARWLIKQWESKVKERWLVITASIQCWKANFCAFASFDKPWPTCTQFPSEQSSSISTQQENLSSSLMTEKVRDWGWSLLLQVIVMYCWPWKHLRGLGATSKLHARVCRNWRRIWCCGSI